MSLQLSESLELILDLASQNMIDEDETDSEFREERKRQAEAFDLVQEHILDAHWSKNSNDETVIYTRLKGQEREDM